MEKIVKLGRPAGNAKQKLIEATASLIINQGFAATTVEQICEKAKTTKGAFFHHFDTKEDIALATLDYFYEYRTSAFYKYRDKVSKNLADRVISHIDFLSTPEAMRFKGCLVGMLATEVGRTHPKIASKCEEKFQAWARDFSSDLKAACPNANAKRITAFTSTFISTFEGSLILAKCTDNPFRIISTTLTHFKTLINDFMKLNLKLHKTGRSA